MQTIKTFCSLTPSTHNLASMDTLVVKAGPVMRLIGDLGKWVGRYGEDMVGRKICEITHQTPQVYHLSIHFNLHSDALVAP